MTNAHLSIAAAAPPSPVGQGIVLMIVGMGVVFVALVIIAAIVMLMNREPKAKASPEPSPTPRAAPTERIPREHLVVIAAAVAATVRQPARISRVMFLGHSSARDWIAGGRATVMGSHTPTGRRQ
ncbi:MAG: hypothetical protein CMJ31_10355 [Phycisphaerae bacterium]|nr:hypothetical protein [Phycisphaerae bacterium]